MLTHAGMTPEQQHHYTFQEGAMRETAVDVREPKTQSETSLNEKLAALQKAGLIRWNGKKLKPMKPLATLPEGCLLSDLIIEERR
jgi:hypothetical protein